MNECSALLLTRQWRDTPHGVEIELWAVSGSGPIKLRFTGTETVAFARKKDLPQIKAAMIGEGAWRHRSLELTTLDGSPAVALYFRRQRSLYDLRDRLRNRNIPLYETDIKPSDRFLMERFARGVIRVRGKSTRRADHTEFLNPKLKAGGPPPSLKSCVLDIETTRDAGHVLSIAVVAASGDQLLERRVWMIDSSAQRDELSYEPVADEVGLVTAFLRWLHQFDPDILMGWNVVNFDLKVLEEVAKRLRLRLTLGRDTTTAHWRKSASGDDHHTLLVPGRLVLDGIDVLRTATYRFESFALENVARQLLGRGKKTDDVAGRGDWIQEAFDKDKSTLAKYNLEDCQLVWDIARQTQMIEFALARAELTGLQADRVGGSVAAFDQRYLPLLHRRGYVAPDVGAAPAGGGSPGGYVMNSRPGLYRNVLVLDFKSLYPSIIRTFKVDPLALATSSQESSAIPGFNDAEFSRHNHILPELITELWAARDQAKARQDAPLSTAIKILMNSFYGVLGTPGCRFFDPRLASAITLRGHEVLRESRRWIQERGYEVIYGDTDSLFVWVGNETGAEHAQTLGKSLADQLNQWWQTKLHNDLQLDSHLEMEFETHYLNFLMPAVRGSDAGSKKRYAGTVRDGNTGEMRLIFKGLEAIRTDWSELAREFQKALYELIFRAQPFEQFMRDIVAATRAGENDTQLTLRKRLGRQPDDYRAPLPPHVRAALEENRRRAAVGDPKRFRRGDWVEYVQTIQGPETVYCLSSPPDRELYVSRQLKPVADAILEFVGTSFEAITGPQLGLFE